MKNLKTRNAFVTFAIISAVSLAALVGAFIGWACSVTGIGASLNSFVNMADHFGKAMTLLVIVDAVVLVLGVLAIVLAAKTIKGKKAAKVVSILLASACVIPAVVLLYNTEYEGEVCNWLTFFMKPEFAASKKLFAGSILVLTALYLLCTYLTIVCGAAYSFVAKEVAEREEIAAKEAEERKALEAAVAEKGSQEELEAMIRRIFKEEIAAIEPAPMFTSPLVVQYFNQSEEGEVAEEAAPAPAPVVEEVKEEPTPVVEAAPVVEEAPAKAPIIRVPFDERIVKAEKDIQEKYNEIKNEILSWGVKSRVSSTGDTFRLHRKTFVKITVAGKGLKLYYALNPNDYKDSTIPVLDASDKGIYEEIPLVFKVKSDLSVRRAKQLIKDLCEKEGLTQGEVATENYVKALRADVRARKASK